MRLLRHPIVAVLLVVAAAFLVWNSLHPRKRTASRSASAANTTNTQSSPKASVKSRKSPAPAPTQSRAAGAPASGKSEDPGPKSTTNAQSAASASLRPINLEVVRQRFATWVEAPLHDPFQINRFRADVSSQEPSPLESMALTAIYRQSGSSLVVINGAVYGEGDSVQGLRLERIEGDAVVLRGPHGDESLHFTPFGSSPRTNQVDRSKSGKGTRSAPAPPRRKADPNT